MTRSSKFVSTLSSCIYAVFSPPSRQCLYSQTGSKICHPRVSEFSVFVCNRFKMALWPRGQLRHKCYMVEPTNLNLDIKIIRKFLAWVHMFDLTDWKYSNIIDICKTNLNEYNNTKRISFISENCQNNEETKIILCIIFYLL